LSLSRDFDLSQTEIFGSIGRRVSRFMEEEEIIKRIVRWYRIIVNLSITEWWLLITIISIRITLVPRLFWYVDSSLCVFIILFVRYFWEAHTFILLIIGLIDLDRWKYDTDGIMCSINYNKAAEGDFYTGDFNNITILWWIRVARRIQCAFHCMTFTDRESYIKLWPFY